MYTNDEEQQTTNDRKDRTIKSRKNQNAWKKGKIQIHKNVEAGAVKQAAMKEKNKKYASGKGENYSKSKSLADIFSKR